MSLYSALRSGVSGLFAQTQAMSMISDNITNVNTTGYKAVRARFSSLVGSASQGAFSAGVVSAVANRSVSTPGQVTTSTANTHIAVNGQGFFAVSNSDDVYLDSISGQWKTNGEVLYTRAGDFSTNANGNLENSAGYVLLGWERNAGNSGYNVSNLVSEFSAINIAGTVGQPLPTQAITMNANLNASLKEGETFTMTAPMYSRQGGISNVEYRFTKLGDGIARREFRVEARVTTGAAQFVNDVNSLTSSAANVRLVDGTVADLPFYGAQVGTNSRELVLNYGGAVELSGQPIANLQVEYFVGTTPTVLTATAIATRGGKVTVTLDGEIPGNAENMRVFNAGGNAANNPLQFALTPAGTVPAVTAGTGPRTLTIPAVGTTSTGATPPNDGTRFTGYYDIGSISFDASGLQPTLTPPLAGRTAAGGYFRVGSIVDGRLSMTIDHSADGQASAISGSDDVKVAMNFNKAGASAGMTSYESASTIYSIDQDGNGSGDLQSVQFNARGELQAIFSRGSPKFLAQIPLMAFNNPNALSAADGNAYRATDAAGVGVSRVAGTGDSGTIAGASLESSNADIATEFTEMIVVQRAYSASTKIITTADEMLDEVIRSKR